MELSVSLVIPVFNAKKYLPECLQSIEIQNYDNLEVLLVDDGSTDGSDVIADEFMTSHPEMDIKVFHRENSGPAASRKFGVENAKGEYILFSDADDTLCEGMIAKLSKTLSEQGSDIVVCQYMDVDEHGHKKETVRLEKSLENIETYETVIYKMHGSRELLGGPYCKLIKKSLFSDIDYFEEVTIGEDYAMLLQLFRNAAKITVISDVLYLRNMHAGNISRSGYTKRHKKALDNYISIRNRLISEFPQYTKEITEYHLEYEMAVITAMCRNKNYDKEVIYKLKADLKDNIKIIRGNDHIPLSHRISAEIILINPFCFVFLFRVLHLLTGR